MSNKRAIQTSRYLLLLIAAAILVIVLASGLSEAAAQPALQPDQPTETPEPIDLPTIIAQPTAEIDPEALILEDGWRNPLNLSRSGATSGPQMVTDSNGRQHILWRDSVEGFGYVAAAGDGWSEPVAAEYPFFTRRYFPDLQDSAATPAFNPELVPGSQGQIVAFWIGDDGILYYSSVPASSFTNYDAWLPRAALSANTAAVSATTSNDGTIHTAYIRQQDSEERPAGVYYRQLDSQGNWQTSVLLYASRYLRSITAEQANIEVFTSNDGNVFVVWDDTLKQQVFFAKSSDNGQTWEQVQIIDRRTREDSETAAGPSGIKIGGDGEQIHLTWKAGHEADQTCSQYIATSSDQGATWTASQYLSLLPTCFRNAQFFVAEGTQFLMGTVEQADLDNERNMLTQTYVLAWDGSRWSDPQAQEPLSRFANPETYQPVRLGCHSAASQDNGIVVIGCDSAEGSDIWLMSREIGEIVEWFPLPPVWQGPNQLSSDDTTPQEVVLVAGIDGSMFAFWNVANGPSIYYAGWNGEAWSPGQEIIRSPRGDTSSLSGASSGDRLYLTWKDQAQGIQISEASLSNPSQWSDPVSLLENRPEASSPGLTADDGGNIYVVYAEQFNETRGVYLLHSADAGETWSDPLQVFDGAAAGWDMVEKPLLARTDNGQMHLMWTRRSLPPDSIPLGLAYSRSEDLGQNWSEAEFVVEAETYWNQLVGVGERSVHRLWSELNGDRDIIWHAYSVDGGLTWSQAEQVSGIFNEGGAAAAADAVDRLHLLTMDNEQLSDLVWEDNTWVVDEGLDTSLENGGTLAAGANVRGELVAAYVEKLGAEGNRAGESNLYAMWRTLDLPQELPTPLPSLTPTPPPVMANPTSTPEPTPTVFFSTEQEAQGISEIPGLDGLPISSDLIVAFLPVLLIVIIGLIIGLRIIRKR